MKQRAGHFFVSVCALLLVGWMDEQISRLVHDNQALTIFFILPLLYVAWNTSWRWTGPLIPFTVFLMVKASAAEAPSQEALLVSASSQLCAYVVAVYLMLRLREVVDHERSLSRTDELTALGNVRAFHKAAYAELSRLRRKPEPLTVIYIDLDEFKQVNDQYGHTEGDHLLFRWGRVLKRSLRSFDTACRIGGDEFCLILPNTSLTGAQAVVQRITREAGRIDGPARPKCSMGIAVFNRPPVSVDEMLQVADAAMYEAKSHGKNRGRFVIVEGPPQQFLRVPREQAVHTIPVRA